MCSIFIWSHSKRITVEFSRHTSVHIELSAISLALAMPKIGYPTIHILSGLPELSMDGPLNLQVYIAWLEFIFGGSLESP